LGVIIYELVQLQQTAGQVFVFLLFTFSVALDERFFSFFKSKNTQQHVPCYLSSPQIQTTTTRIPFHGLYSFLYSFSLSSSSEPVMKSTSVYRWITQANEIIGEGYRSYPGGICIISTMDGWQIVLSGGKPVDDMREASDEVLSADVFTEEVLQAYYTMHPNVIKSSYHIDVIRSPLTRNIGPRLSDIYEVKATMSEKIPLSNGEWCFCPHSY
ncbi:hypothetical protein K435DRAFT_929342, partial [Dendrothele bispora CBS 962.96]